eukprot:1289435-Amphidinium_carterae.2
MGQTTTLLQDRSDDRGWTLVQRKPESEHETLVDEWSALVRESIILHQSGIAMIEDNTLDEQWCAIAGNPYASALTSKMKIVRMWPTTLKRQCSGEEKIVQTTTLASSQNTIVIRVMAHENYTSTDVWSALMKGKVETFLEGLLHAPSAHADDVPTHMIMDAFKLVRAVLRRQSWLVKGAENLIHEPSEDTGALSASCVILRMGSKRSSS